jgi:hypothetical protein
MKMSSNFYRFAGRRPGRGQISWIVFACAITMFAVGCSKKNQSSVTSVPPAQPQTDAAQPAPAAPSTVVNSGTTAAVTTNGLPDLRPLNQALMGWVYQNGRRPANFEEFAASTGVPIPPPPAGMKYTFNSRGLISIVNR